MAAPSATRIALRHLQGGFNPDRYPPIRAPRNWRPPEGEDKCPPGDYKKNMKEFLKDSDSWLRKNLYPVLKQRGWHLESYHALEDDAEDDGQLMTVYAYIMVSARAGQKIGLGGRKYVVLDRDVDYEEYDTLGFEGEMEEVEVEHSEQWDVDEFSEWTSTALCPPLDSQHLIVDKRRMPLNAGSIKKFLEGFDRRWIRETGIRSKVQKKANPLSLQPDYGKGTAAVPRGEDDLVQRVALRHIRKASTNTERFFYKATDGKWYVENEAYDENEDGEQIEGDTTSYGPFPSFHAAEKWIGRSFANSGGYSEDDSGRQRPPRNPVKPRRSRWAGYEAKLGLPDQFPHRWPFVYAHGAAEVLLEASPKASDIFHGSVRLERFEVGVHDVEFMGQNATAYIWNDRGMKGGLVTLDSDRSGSSQAKSQFNKHLAGRRASTRVAFNKYNPDELLMQLVEILEKYELDDAADAVKKVTPSIQRAWRSRERLVSASRVASRHLATIQPYEVAKLHLHLSNSGAAFTILDAGNGPEFVLSTSTFGKMDSQIHLQIDQEGLRRIADMLHIAAGHNSFSTPWDVEGGLDPSVDDLHTYDSKQLLPSMGRSLAWWKSRKDAEGYNEMDIEEFISAYRAALPAYTAHFEAEKTENSALDDGDDMMESDTDDEKISGRDALPPMPPADRVALRHLKARNPPLHEAAVADEALGTAYRSLVDLKLGFDSWEEIPPSSRKLYDLIGKAMGAIGKARKDTYQIRMMVQRGKYAGRPDTNDRYVANVKEVRALLEEINGHITTHEAKQAADTQDWGYAGDLDHAKMLLGEVTRFLNDDR